MSGGNGSIRTPQPLASLLPELAGTVNGALEVSGITLDSREVRPGDAFLALRGATHDGLAFAAEALQRGACVVLADAGSISAPAGDVVPVERLGERVSEIAGRFFGEPSTRMLLIGVTGTNGKTTCSQLVANAFDVLGTRCGVIGTLGWGFPGQLAATTHTTPDAVTVQRMLAELLDAGARAVAMEVSSHALEQGRVSALRFDTAVFTNLSHDHLDYHGSLEDYAASKRLLFSHAGLRHAVINADDDWGARLLRTLPAQVQSFGYSLNGSEAPLRAMQFAAGPAGMHAVLESPWGTGVLQLPLLGRFNMYNALAVLGALCANGIALGDALDALGKATPVAGRMQRIAAAGRAPLVIVDYAHTPDALGQTLAALRGHVSGRLWCVFGCGGDRDRAKRPLMGRIAWERADEVIVTSDNPRSEDPQAIIEEIATGIPPAGARCIGDRAAAIRLAITEAAHGDCVLIAGKGHETFQEIAGARLPFSDAEVARDALVAREGRP